MLPKIQAVFRLTREPEFKISGQGTPVCKVGLACSEKYGDKETQLFIDGTAFKKTAEMLNQVQKGHRINVVGKINTESWENNGQKHSKTVMVIESFEFIEKRDNSQQSYEAPRQSQQQPHTAYQPQQAQQPQQNNYGQQSMPQQPDPIDDQMEYIPF